MKLVVLANLFLALGVHAFSNEIPPQWSDDITLTLRHFGGNSAVVNQAVIERIGYHSYYEDGINRFTPLFLQMINWTVFLKHLTG